MRGEGTSFPVGKVERLEMFPMSFEEFVIADGGEKYINGINKIPFECEISELYTVPMQKYLDSAKPVSITFDKLDVFTATNGMLIVNLTATEIPEDFQTLVDDIRCDVCCTNSNIQSDFKLHVTLGLITESPGQSEQPRKYFDMLYPKQKVIP